MAARPTGLEELADGVFAHVPDDHWANTGIIVGDDSVLVVDARLTPRMARELIDMAAYVTPKPIRYLVDTHHHGDHSFGNVSFAPFAAIIGHANTRRALERDPEMHKGWAARYPHVADDLAEVVITPPVITFEDKLTISLGAHTVELRHFGPAHTDNDSVVAVPGARVAFMGDLVCNGFNAVLSDGDSAGWERALEAVQSAWNVQRLVPGHGPTADGGALAEQRAYLRALRQAVRELRDAGVSAEQAQQQLAAVPGFEHYQNRSWLQRGIPRLYAELARAAG
jgi:cyclase